MCISERTGGGSRREVDFPYFARMKNTFVYRGFWDPSSPERKQIWTWELHIWAPGHRLPPLMSFGRDRFLGQFRQKMQGCVPLYGFLGEKKILSQRRLLCIFLVVLDTLITDLKFISESGVIWGRDGPKSIGRGARTGEGCLKKEKITPHMILLGALLMNMWLLWRFGGVRRGGGILCLPGVQWRTLLRLLC